MASNSERRRKKAARPGALNVPSIQSTAQQGTQNPCAGSSQRPPLCAVVNSLPSVLLASVQMNPSNNTQLLSMPQLEPATTFGELENYFKTFTEELCDSERRFHEMVANINSTDRLIFKNTSLLERLLIDLNELQNTSNDATQDLTKAFSELNVLEETVHNLEKHLDGERIRYDNCLEWVRKENLYNCTIQISANINYLEAQISEAICMNNVSQSGSCHQTNPVQQIGCILDQNYETLVRLEHAMLESKEQMDRISCLQKEFQRR